jgi:hypothetical protein
MIYEDADVLVFRNLYPTLRGYTMVCPRRHVGRVIGDFAVWEYLRLQCWVFRVGGAIDHVVPTERLYLLSLGGQQGNVTFTGTSRQFRQAVPYEQQLAVPTMRRGTLPITSEEMAPIVLADPHQAPRDPLTRPARGRQRTCQRHPMLSLRSLPRPRRGTLDSAYRCRLSWARIEIVRVSEALL